eukprot:385028-Rhodomonas_salina.1
MKSVVRNDQDSQPRVVKWTESESEEVQDKSERIPRSGLGRAAHAPAPPSSRSDFASPNPPAVEDTRVQFCTVSGRGEYKQIIEKRSVRNRMIDDKRPAPSGVHFLS